jgi:AraC-like DNA-binding protein
MSLLNFTRSPASIALLVEFGKEAGIDASLILKGSKLSSEQLNDPNIEISAYQEIQVIKNILRLSQEQPTIGLYIGQRYKPSVYGMWGFGLISSATLADAISHALRFLPLTFAFSSIRYRNDGNYVHLQFEETNFKEDLKNFILCREMSSALTLIKNVLGDKFSLHKITLLQSEHKSISIKNQFKEVFGVSPTYNAHANTLVFDQSYLASTLPLAAPTAASMCNQFCLELLEKRRSKLGAVAIVRQYLGIQLHQAPQLLDMANLLNTSERTLKRMLASENTSFRKLVKEFQCSESIDYLTNSNLNISEIADILGFSDASSFSQSFKRWTGVSPLLYRNMSSDERKRLKE